MDANGIDFVCLDDFKALLGGLPIYASLLRFLYVRRQKMMTDVVPFLVRPKGPLVPRSTFANESFLGSVPKNTCHPLRS